MSTIVSERAQKIEAYIEQNPACKIDDSWPMEFGGRVHTGPVYELPISLLCYNLKNGRYAVQLARLQADEGYELDPTRATDHTKLHDLLLSLDREQTEMLKEDLSERGQIYPGVITQDGFVINANRRMAILETLHAEHPGGQHEKLKVQRLPDVNDADLWRLEAGLQLSRDTRAEYSPINELLKLREGVKAGLTPAAIAAAMYGRKTTWVVESLERLSTMEQYLVYFNLEGQHHLLDGTDEQFVELQRNMKALEREGLTKEDQFTWLVCLFQLIRARVSNWDLRDVKKIALDDDAAEPLYEEVITKSEPGVTLAEKDVVEAFDAAQARMKSKQEANQPTLLLQKALAALGAIEPKDPNVAKGKAKFLFNKIRKRVKELEAALG